MRRRHVFTLLAGAAASPPLAPPAGRAQQAATSVIGFSYGAAAEELHCWRVPTR
jgi:hypothetical protein